MTLIAAVLSPCCVAFKRPTALVLALLICVSASSAFAQPSTLYLVENVLAKGVGDGSEAARKRAFELAHIAALREVVSRVTPGRTGEGLPLPSMSKLTAMIEELQVTDERMNELTYVGLMTFRFKPQAITAFLADNGTEFAVAQARPFVVLPVLVVNGQRLLWEPNNVWASAWRDSRFKSGLVPFLVPSGSADDRATFNLTNVSRDQVANAARTLATTYGAAGVLLAEARLIVENGTLLSAEILINRRGGSLGPERLTHEEAAKLGDRPLDLLVRAADVIAARYTEAWKSESAIEGQTATTLTFESENDDLENWFALEQKLISIGIIQSVDLLSLGDGLLTADLTFRGRLDQLTRVLAQQQLELIPSGDRFYLAQR